jgi:hypothetical protein
MRSAAPYSADADFVATEPGVAEVQISRFGGKYSEVP